MNNDLYLVRGRVFLSISSEPAAATGSKERRIEGDPDGGTETDRRVNNGRVL